MSKSSKNRLNRRAFLNGLTASGLGLYLPFLRSLEARAQTAGAAPKRVVIIALQHGWQRIWHSEVTLEPVAINGPLKSNGELSYSDDFSFTNAFAPLNQIKSKVAFLDGIRPGPWWGNAHDSSYSNILTCAVPFGEGDSGQFPIPQNESIDHYLARKMGVSALRVNAAYRSFGVQYHPLSWNQNAAELPFFTQPLTAFNFISNELNAAASNQPSPTSNGQASRSRHVLDEVLSDTKRIERELSGQSKQEFQRYLELLEALQKKLVAPVASGGAANVPIPAVPQANPTQLKMIDDYFSLLVATTALATHPVAVLGLGEANTDLFPWRDSANVARVGQVGLASQGDFHHKMAHYKTSFVETQGQVEAQAVSGWAAWNMEQVVKFAKSLDAITDSDGRTVLDNTLIVLLGEVGDGQHDTSHWGVPLIGGGFGRLAGNRYYDLPKTEPRNRQGFYLGALDRNGNRHENPVNYGKPIAQFTLSDLWTTVADMGGQPVNRWGFDVYNTRKLKLG